MPDLSDIPLEERDPEFAHLLQVYCEAYSQGLVPSLDVYMEQIKKNIGRNDPCWCGSGKKYKKCHLKEG